MSKSDVQRLLEMSKQAAELQRQMHEILKSGSFDSGPRQAIAAEEIVDQRLLAVLKPETASKQVGEMLRVFRESAQIPQTQVAGLIGRGDHRSVRRYELGETNQSITGLTEHAQALGGVAVWGIQTQDRG